MNKVVLNQVKKCGVNCVCGDKILTIIGNTNISTITNEKKNKLLMNTLETYKNEQLQCYKYKNFRFIEHSLQRMKREEK
jgi:hypothetical protein